MLKICITNYARFCERFKNAAAENDYHLNLRRLAELEDAPNFVILREKLDRTNYRALAKKLQPVFKKKLIVHSRAELADELEIPLHLPFTHASEILCTQKIERIPFFSISVHSVDDIQELEKLPPHIKSRIAFVLAGHVFSTPSHQKIPGKGLNYLKEVVDCSPFDVIAVGGINNPNLNAIKSADAAGWAGISTWLEKLDTFTLLRHTMLR